jgi:hypothetical protein
MQPILVAQCLDHLPHDPASAWRQIVNDLRDRLVLTSKPTLFPILDWHIVSPSWLSLV